MFYYDSQIAARLFDLQHEGDLVLEAEQEFLLEEIARTDGPVLDLGCGTGRTFLPALDAGHDVFGCDGSRAFLQVLLGKADAAGLDVAGRLWLCDLGSPAARAWASREAKRETEAGNPRDEGGFEGFPLAFAAFRTFDHLAGEGARERFLTGARALLRPGERLLLNLANPALDALAAASGQKVLMRDDLRDPATGRRVVWWGATQFEAGPNLVHEAVQYDFLEAGGRVAESYYFPFTMRWTPAEEMRRLAREAGFEVAACWSEFGREPFESGSGDAVWDLRRT